MYRTIKIRYILLDERDKQLNEMYNMGYEYYSTIKIEEKDSTFETITLRKKNE